MATNIKQQLKDLLIELFQLHNTDLDFGIYRILNLKAQEIENFINNQLDSKIEEVKAKILNRQNQDLKDELERLKQELETDFDPDFENIDAGALPKQLALKFEEKMGQYRKAKSDLELQRVSEDTERSIYNELFRFFERYYEEGDFISKPRAGRNNYMIPYEGEEVKLYWANYDQYYIKTGDNFKNYVFNNQASTADTLTEIEFKIVDVEVSLNNNKEEKGRLFIPTEEPVEWIAEERKLLLKFYYRVPTAEEKRTWGEKQSVKADNKGINQRFALYVTEKATAVADAELLLFLSKTRANSRGEAIPILLYHLDRYTAVNKFDYFVHKDLKGFLKRELDFFLKNEVLSIQFLNADWKEEEVQDAIKNNVLRASAIRDVALSIIEFIGELEDFQKRLFEKKKFVVNSDFICSLSLIPSAIYDEIIEYILQDERRLQANEWIEYYFIKESDLQPDPPPKKRKSNASSFTQAKAFLSSNENLLIDTKYLPLDLKWKFLCSFDNLDALTTGYLLNTENFQGLSFIANKFKGKVTFSYIDPPYNTGDDGFPYKDGFMSSTWLSMMFDRLKLAKKIINKDGLQFIHIDFHELNHLYQICNKIYGLENFISMFNVKVRHEARILKADKDTHEIIEQVLAYKASYHSLGINKKEEDNTSIEDYKYEISFNEEPSETIEVDGWTVEVFQLGSYQINKTSEAAINKLKPIDIRGSLMQGNSTGRILNT